MNVYPAIPEEGLEQVLSSWLGRGSIWDALIPSEFLDPNYAWSAQDVRRRARRVLFQQLIAHLKRWPTRQVDWLDLLPAAKSVASVIYPVPFSGVSWTQSRIKYGWVPSSFVGREAARGTDMLLVTSLRWTVQQLVELHQDIERIDPDVGKEVEHQLDAASALLSQEPLASAIFLQPTRAELLALRRARSPFGAVADTAQELTRFDSISGQLATARLIPDDAIRWRLFHLAVLGSLLTALRSLGCVATSLRPLGFTNAQPAYHVSDSEHRDWFIWFEASGIWSNFTIRSPYVEATGDLSETNRALGADLMLILPNSSALILECKYSWKPETVRAGYYQAATYALEAKSRLTSHVTSYTIGPEDVVKSTQTTNLSGMRVGTAPPSALPGIVDQFLKESGVSMRI